MKIDLVAQVWKEVRGFVHDTHDKQEAAEALVAVLMENFDTEEILDGFKFDKMVINSVAEYAGVDAVDADDDDYYDDDY